MRALVARLRLSRAAHLTIVVRAFVLAALVLVALVATTVTPI